MTSAMHRDSTRNRRPRAVRAVTISTKRIAELDLGLLRHENPPETCWRPKTRGDCLRGWRPCPFVACHWHLYLDVIRDGAIKLNFPDLEPHEMPVTCALDVADLGGRTFDQLSHLLNVTRARAQQLEVLILQKLKRRARFL